MVITRNLLIEPRKLSWKFLLMNNCFAFANRYRYYGLVSFDSLFLKQDIKHIFCSILCRLWFIFWVSNKEFVFQKKNILVTLGTSWPNQQLPGLTRNKGWTFWFTQEDRNFSKPLTKPITRKVKNQHQNKELFFWLVPGSCQEVSISVYL